MHQVPENLSKWSSLQAQLNESGNFLIEVTDSSTSSSLANELGKLNRRWADFIKRTKFVSIKEMLPIADFVYLNRLHISSDISIGCGILCRNEIFLDILCAGGAITAGWQLSTLCSGCAAPSAGSRLDTERDSGGVF